MGSDANGGLSQTAANSKDAASSFADQTKQTVSAFASSAADYASSAADSAADYGGQVKRAVGEQSDRIVQQTQSSLRSMVNRVLQDQPLAIAVAGLAAGAAVAAAFPVTDIEDQTLRPIGEKAAETAERLGGRLKEATAQAGEKLKSAADERGLNAQGLKEVANEVADTFSSTMSGKSERDAKSRPGPSNSSAAIKQNQPQGT